MNDTKTIIALLAGNDSEKAEFLKDPDAYLNAKGLGDEERHSLFEEWANVQEELSPEEASVRYWW